MSQPNLPARENRSPASTQPPPILNLVGSNPLRQQPQVRQLPQHHHAAPVWLKSLLTMQRGAMVLFFTIFGLSAVVYGYTVYTQDAWKSQHGQLKRLQKQERQQGVMNENLKQQMAKTAEQPGSGLVLPTPDKIVFIPSAPPRPAKTIATPQSPQPISASKLPAGY
jgi:cell division protein FtsL